MEAILFLIILTALLVGLLSQAHDTGARYQVDSVDQARHRADGRSHVYYWHNDELIYESEACTGCMQNRVAALKRDGNHVDEVIDGHYDSGDLLW